MSVNVSAYVERKIDGKWELVTQKPICTRLKYVIKDYNELPRLKWDDLSDGLKEKWAKDEDGNVYGTFHTTTLEELESKAETTVKETFTHINTIIKALGVELVYNNEGDEMDWGMSDEKSDKLTFPVNKELIIDLQYAFETIRNIGQREAFDLFVCEHVDYGKEHRIILVVD